MPKFTKADVARQYRDKYGPDMPTHQLARIMYKEKYKLFTDEENARYTLRYIEGKTGSVKRKQVQKTRHLKEEPRPHNPYALPESYAEEQPIFKLPKGCTRVLYLPDLHIPYHDIPAITAAIDYGVKMNVNGIVLPGDVIDMHKGSKYEPDPHKRSIKQEFEAADQFLQKLRDIFPGVPIYWLEGNHDYRWKAFLLRKSPEIYDDNYFHLEDRLRLIAKNIQFFDQNTIIKAGNLNVTHGHKIFNGGWGAPVYPAKTVYDKTGLSFAIGHVHTVTTYKKVRKGGAENVMCYTMGCLSEINPGYNPIVNRYEHGFGYQEIDSDGRFEFQNIRVENGKIKM